MFKSNSINIQQSITEPCVTMSYVPAFASKGGTGTCRCITTFLMIDYNPFKHIALTTAEFNQYNSLRLIERTIRRYIHRLKINSYVSVQKPFLSKKNITTRIRWTEKYKEWTTMQCTTVAFIDESSPTVLPMKNRSRVWRIKQRRYDLKYLIPMFKSGYKTVNI